MLALYEWMALREALEDGAAPACWPAACTTWCTAPGSFGDRLETFTAVLDDVPQRQTRLAKWPVATLIPFAAQPAGT